MSACFTNMWTQNLVGPTSRSVGLVPDAKGVEKKIRDLAVKAYFLSGLNFKVTEA